MCVLSTDSLSGQTYYCNLAFHVAVHLTQELVNRCKTLPLPREQEGDVEERGRTEEDGVDGSVDEGKSTCGVGSEVTVEEGRVVIDLQSLSEEQLSFLAEVSVLLPAVRVWVEWLVIQEGFWLSFLSSQNTADL